MMEIEATRISPTRQKFDFDYVKVLVETKDNTDFLKIYIDHGPSCMQFCGLDIYNYHLAHTSDTFYINNKIDHCSIPSSVNSFEFAKHLCALLLTTKEEWMNLRRNLVNDNGSSSSSEAQNGNKYKKSPSWHPPQPEQKLPNLYLLHSMLNDCFLSHN